MVAANSFGYYIARLHCIYIVSKSSKGNMLTSEAEQLRWRDKQLQIRHASALLCKETYRDKVQWRTANGENGA